MKLNLTLKAESYPYWIVPGSSQSLPDTFYRFPRSVCASFLILPIRSLHRKVAFGDVKNKEIKCNAKGMAI